MKIMQEQAPYKITPEQGWTHMKSILDKEMPVQKRSRRMIVFWWSIVGVALMGLTGAFAFRSDFIFPKSKMTSPIQQAVPNPSKPAEEIKTQDYTSAAKNEFGKPAKPEERIASSVIETKSTPSSSKKEIVSSTGKSHNLKSADAGNMIAKSSASSWIANQNVDDHSAISMRDAEELTTSTFEVHTNVETDNAQPEITEIRSSEIAGPVPALAMGYFTIPINELGPIQASAFTTPEKHRLYINPCIEANVLSGFSGGTGWYAGAGADLKLSSRFNLTTGLGYRSFHPGANLFSSPNADLASDPSNNGLVKNDTIYDGFYVPGESINNASYQDLDPVIESLHQWQAQMGLDWKLSRKFSLEGGLGFAFLTRAYSEYPILPKSYAATNTTTRVSNSLEGYDVIRKTMASCFAGVSYHLGRHVALKLQWLHTFQPYLNTDGNTASFVSGKQRDDYIRGITLGIKYSFL
jgi:hypothetical protein